MYIHPSNKELRKFGLFVGIAFPLILGGIIPFIYGHPFANWTIFIGIPLIILGIIQPKLLLLIYKVWIQLGTILGWINSRIILGIIFILILIPISFVMSLVGHDPLRIRRKNQTSYRENRNDQIIELTRIF